MRNHTIPSRSRGDIVLCPRSLSRRCSTAVLCLLATSSSLHRCWWVHAITTPTTQQHQETSLENEEETRTSKMDADDVYDNDIFQHHPHLDTVEDSFLDPLAADPSCVDAAEDCFSPPESTLETEIVLDATCFKGGKDYSEEGEDGIVLEDISSVAINSSTTGSANEDQCVAEAEDATATPRTRIVDKHWSNDPQLKDLRKQLRQQALSPFDDRRPPIFLMPGLASTRLVAWKLKTCKRGGVFDTKIKVQDNVWLNINLVLQMGTINVQCMTECLRLGLNQSDTDDWTVGCKLRPDEGLDAIASLAPGGIGSSLLVGGTNTVYAWLIQWLADHLGYDVTNIVGLPYDWRLSPDKMEARDGFLTMTRRRIEAAVASNGGQPGIMVSHSMGNLVFRYFLEWLRVEMREEAYQEYITRARRRKQRQKKAQERSKELQKKQQREEKQQEQNVQELQQEQHQHLVIDREQGNDAGNIPPEANAVTSSFFPGWLIAAVPGFDGLMDWARSMAQFETNEEAAANDGPLEANNAGPADLVPEGVDVLVDQASPEVAMTNKSDNDQIKKVVGDAEISEEEQDAHDAQLRELAIEEGDAKWLEWLETHIWTYIGLSAPLLGAVNPLRSVLSGENMGLPINDDVARYMEVTFGSTHTLNPVSIATGFCDQWDNDDWAKDDVDASQDQESKAGHASRLACLDDIMNDIEYSSVHRDPWKNFPALKSLLRDRTDWDTGKPMVDIKVELCQNTNGSGKKDCVEKETLRFGPKDVESGYIFNVFNSLWKEEGDPLIIKREQLEESFMNTKVKNMLNTTWERPQIKHVVMAYGVDIPTEVGYIYRKKIDVDDLVPDGSKNKTGGMPNLHAVLWEEANGHLLLEPIETARGSLAEHFIGRKTKKVPFNNGGPPRGHVAHSGDGSVPYISLSWVHTWLLHAARARRFGQENGQLPPPSRDRKNALDHISISHRPRGAIDWVAGPPPAESDVSEPTKLVDEGETEADHPHGTQYKPLMTRYHNVGISRTTGIEYTTTVIEAVGVEHKETTRNYDILAAVFSDAIQFMHDDLGLVASENATETESGQ